MSGSAFSQSVSLQTGCECPLFGLLGRSQRDQGDKTYAAARHFISSRCRRLRLNEFSHEMSYPGLRYGKGRDGFKRRP
jgi:hypothetical protein